MNEKQQPIWVKALLDINLSPAAHRVFTYLYWRQGQNGKSWPTQSLIAEELGLSRRAVQIITKKLEGLGYIQIIRPDVQGRGQPLQYSIIDHIKGRNECALIEDKGRIGVRPSKPRRAHLSTKEGRTERTTNTKSITLPIKTNSHLLQIFDHWNNYKGKQVVKDGQTIRWHSHQLKADGLPSPEVHHAVKTALAGKYSPEQICGAIDNYAKVLLGPDFIWTYVWSLANFLTRGEEKHKEAARKWWRFLPDNFIEQHFLTESAKRKRSSKESGSAIALSEMREHFSQKIKPIGKKDVIKAG